MWNPLTIPFFAQSRRWLQNTEQSHKPADKKGGGDAPLFKHPTTDLTLAEQEALHLLMEECSEVIKASAKILRHGKIARDSSGEMVVEYDNLAMLGEEMGHVSAAAHLCRLLGLVVEERVQQSTVRKFGSVQTYLHHIILVKEGEGPK
jgi:hypothetical protein